MTTLKVTYRKSAIGYSRDQKATIAALGLRRLHQTVEHQDTPALRGMVHKVRHLVSIDGTPADSPEGAALLASRPFSGGAAAVTPPLAPVVAQASGGSQSGSEMLEDAPLGPPSAVVEEAATTAPGAVVGSGATAVEAPAAGRPRRAARRGAGEGARP